MKKSMFMLLVSILVIAGCANQKQFGDMYFGQTPPGLVPELFAPGIVSTGPHEHSSPTFSPDGREVYWTVVDVPFQRDFPHKIVYSKFEKGKWSRPETAVFSGIYSDDGPRFSPDGQRLYFYSKRPDAPFEQPKQTVDIWYVEKEKNKWGIPVNIGLPVNTDRIETSPSLTWDGTLYFMSGVNEPEVQYNLCRSKCVHGRFAQPEMLDERINSPYHDNTPFVASDESYFIFSSVNRPDGFGRGDLYICFKTKNGDWSDPVNMGKPINSSFNERFPSVSPDENYLFFVSDIKKENNENNLHTPQNGYCDVYWVNADAIQILKSRILSSGR